MGAALDRVIDLAQGGNGTWEWDTHPKAAGFYNVELRLPGDEPVDGSGPTIDQAALNLLAAHYPLAIHCDPVLAALTNEHSPSEAH